MTRTKRYDLHVHTCYSYDSLLSLKALGKMVCRRGLDGVAVLDHDVVEGAVRLRDEAPFDVIVGEEIGTADGGIAALFVEDRIPPHLSAEETVLRIREQGGLVFVPHPLSQRVPGRIREAKLRQLVHEIDIIEGYNARTPLASDDARACQFAAEHGIPVAAGSDGHFACEIGRALTEMEGFATPHEFLQNLQGAQMHGEGKTFFMVPALTIAGIPALTLWRWAKRRWRHHGSGCRVGSGGH